MKAKTNIEYPTNHSPLARALAGTYEKRSARKTPGQVIKVLKDEVRRSGSAKGGRSESP